MGNASEMAKQWPFHVQSCLGMVWNLFENFDFRTILTPSDFRKGTLPNFGHFDSQSWVQGKDHPELLSLNILCADRFEPKHEVIRKKKNFTKKKIFPQKFSKKKISKKKKKKKIKKKF